MTEQPADPMLTAHFTVTATSGPEIGRANVDVPGLPTWADVPEKWATWSAVDVATWTAMTTFTPKEDT